MKEHDIYLILVFDGMSCSGNVLYLGRTYYVSSTLGIDYRIEQNIPQKAKRFVENEMRAITIHIGFNYERI